MDLRTETPIDVEKPAPGSGLKIALFVAQRPDGSWEWATPNWEPLPPFDGSGFWFLYPGGANSGICATRELAEAEGRANRRRSLDHVAA